MWPDMFTNVGIKTIHRSVPLDYAFNIDSSETPMLKSLCPKKIITCVIPF